MRIKSFVNVFTSALFLVFVLSSILYSQSSVGLGERYAIIIGGIGGQEEFTERFFDQTNRMHKLLIEELGYKSTNVFYLFENPAYDSVNIDAECTATNIRDVLNQLIQKMRAEDQLFIFMVGHGTFDGNWSKFNLIGPDLKDIEYAQLLAQLPTKKIVLVNTSSASGPFIQKLSGEERVIITATKNGREIFDTTFADFFLEAFTNNQADLNKDNRVSMLEAFEYAQTAQKNWYEEENRLSAEHPVLDDNGDGEGSQNTTIQTDGKWASRVYLAAASTELQAAMQRLSAGAQTPADSLRLEKVRLEQAIEDLKARKGQLSEQDYSAQLEALLIKLARTNQRLKSISKTEK